MTSGPTMRAVTHHRFGPPAEVLACEVVAAPEPKPGEVLIRMVAAPINPSDLLAVAGQYRPDVVLPAIPGFEGVGVVVDASGTPELQPGRRVLALRGGGTWAETVAIPRETAIAVPDALGDEVASQLYVNGLTAWLLLTRELEIRPDELIVANAAASAFGRCLAQFCRKLGADLVAVTRSPVERERLLALGAAAVVDESREDVAEAVARVAAGRPVRAALDAVGGTSAARLALCLRPGAPLVYYARLSGRPIAMDPAELIALGIEMRGFWLRRWVDGASLSEWHDAFRDLIAVALEIDLDLPVMARLPLSQIREAVALSTSRDKPGKILLVPG